MVTEREDDKLQRQAINLIAAKEAVMQNDETDDKDNPEDEDNEEDNKSTDDIPLTPIEVDVDSSNVTESICTDTNESLCYTGNSDNQQINESDLDSDEEEKILNRTIETKIQEDSDTVNKEIQQEKYKNQITLYLIHSLLTVNWQKID